MHRLLISLSFLALAALGCGAGGLANPATPAGRQELAELPGLRSSPHQGLAAELTLIEHSGSLPLQLSPPQADQAAPTRPPAVEKLNRAFPPLSRQLVVGPLAEIYRGGPLALSPVQLERGRELVQQHAAALAEFRAALPTAPGGLGTQLASGTLAAEPNVTTRVGAANLRGDALYILAAIAAHDQASPATHEQLFALLSANTADWPADSLAWIGDRAAGLVIYELVREGHYLSLLSADEVADLHRRQVLTATARAAVRRIDDDELFYLQAMRQLIDAAGLPYCDRQATLADIRQRLQSRQQSSAYPLVAGTLLLADFETGHRRQAEDFARCQAALLALGIALGHDMPAVANPLTGRPYAIDRTALAVTVAGVLPDRDEPCRVPIFPRR
jgi:hypothetical protein